MSVCQCCGEPAVHTEFSPYMDDYCDDCTHARCDIASSKCPRRQARSAVTGRWVSLKFALKHPKRTIIETVTRHKS